MGILGNILWFICGGLLSGLSWVLAGCLWCISIIGIPIGLQCFKFAGLAFFPFGKEAIDRQHLSGEGDVGTGSLGMIGNIVWFILAGWWLAVGHIVSSIACFVTIIGIPFGIQHLKLAGIALAPIGKTIVEKEVAQAARNSKAQAELSRIRKIGD